MDNRFLTAFIAPRRFEMCGLRMRPFSCRMYLNLCAIDSPFMLGKEPTPEDVMLFLKFCSGEYETIADVKKFSIWEKIAIAKMYGDIMAFSTVVQNICTYMQEYMSAPRVVEMPNNKKTILANKRSLPEIMMLVTILIAKVGFSEEEAWNMSIGKAVWYTTSYAVLEGAELKFISTEEEEAAERDKEAIRKHVEEQVAKLQRAMADGIIKQKNIKTA